ncbi:MAG TPA: hypothetical protein PKX87_05480 [Alphaproteobacteria bacterium]|nr:hypothetical protein [Alphaproteobacteria bacterium]
MTESVTHLVVSRLAVERCQNYLAHLHALMHLCEPADLGLEPPLAESVRHLMGALSTDLTLTARTLRRPEEDPPVTVASRPAFPVVPRRPASRKPSGSVGRIKTTLR